MVLLVVGLAALWPYYEVLGFWPISRDATTWVVSGNPHADGWADWVFRTRHFRVSYRPLTALSYTANYLLGGYDAWPYRGTDLFLHAAVGWLTYGLYRRVWPGAPRWGGLLAALVVWGHPLVDEVAPHLARRSYALASALSLLGLVIAVPRATNAVEGRVAVRAGRALLGGVLLAAALLANETAIVAVAALPLLRLHRRGEGARAAWGALLAAAPAMVLAGVVVVVRQLVIGGVGGYAVDVDRAARVAPIFRACLQSLLMSRPLVPGAGSGAGWLGVGVASLFGAGVGCVVVVACRRRLRCATTRGLVVTAAWVGGYVLLYSMMGVWFPRQMYPVLPALGLLVAGGVASAARPGSVGVRMMVAGPSAVLLIWLMAQSPLIRGPEPQRAAGWRLSNAVLRDLYTALRDDPTVESVELVVPYYERTPNDTLRARDSEESAMLGLRQPATWIAAVLAERDLRIRPLLVFVQNPLQREERARLARDAGAGFLVIPSGAAYFERRNGGLDERSASTEERRSLESMRAGLRGGSRLFVHDGHEFVMLANDSGGN